MDGGGGDVDDRGVEQIHEVGDQDDGRDDPAQAVALRTLVEVGAWCASMRSSCRTEVADRSWRMMTYDRSLRTMYVTNDVLVK